MAKKLGHTATAWIQAGTRCQISETYQKISYFVSIGKLSQGLLNRWTSQLDLGCATGGLERIVSVHNST